MDLQDLPITVLQAMREALEAPATLDEDREALRMRDAGYHVTNFCLLSEDPTEEIPSDDRVRPGEQAVVLRFKAAG